MIQLLWPHWPNFSHLVAKGGQSWLFTITDLFLDIFYWPFLAKRCAQKSRKDWLNMVVWMQSTLCCSVVWHWRMPLFVFFWFSNCVLLFDKSLILGCLWPLVFVLNNILILGIWCSTIPHFLGCFCPWTFFQNIGFNTVLTDLLCHILLLNLDILQGSFRLCNWLSLRRVVSWINYLPHACWSTFWISNFKQQLGCKFDIMENNLNFFVFDICNYICLDTWDRFLVLPS